MNSISVVIPTWNRAAMIKTAILSALDQTLSPLEVLVCDDGSTDNTLEIVNSIKDPRVKWIPGEHSGMPAAPRNRGIKASQGEWVALLDSDDEWLPDKLEKQFELLKRTGCKASSTNAHQWIRGEKRPDPMIVWGNERITFNNLIKENYIVSSSVIVHASVCKNAVGFPEELTLRAFEDYAFWLRVAAQTDFSFCDSSLVKYTVGSPDSVYGKLSLDRWGMRKLILNNLLKWASAQKCIDRSCVVKIRQQVLIDLWHQCEEIMRKNVLAPMGISYDRR